jgi:hypothetical protein
MTILPKEVLCRWLAQVSTARGRLSISTSTDSSQSPRPARSVAAMYAGRMDLQLKGLGPQPELRAHLG